jgi:hypothetical protein
MERMREPRPARSEHSQQGRGAESPRRVEQIVERADRRLGDMLRARPDLRQFVPPGSRGRARSVLQGVPDFLRAHPQVVEDLLLVSGQEGTGVTTMLVVPEFPLVLADTGGSITALAPVLSCTRSAIAKEYPTVHPGTYDTLSSAGGLDDALWEHAVRTPRHMFVFDPETMNPADYIALAVRAFENEPFRMRFAKGDATFTPLV